MANQVRAVNGIGIVDVQEINGVENTTSSQNMEKLNGSTWEYGGTTVTKAIPQTDDSIFSNSDDGFGFNAAWHSIKMLTDYRALIVWTAGGSSTGGKTFARIAQADSGGDTITYGTYQTIQDSGYFNIGDIAVDTVTDNKALYVAADEDDGNAGKAWVLSISGTDITVNSAATFEADATSANTAVANDPFTADKYLIVYDHIGDEQIQAKVCTVSGTTPSFGSMAVVGDMGDLSVDDVYYPYVEADPFNTGRYLVAWNTYVSTGGDHDQRLSILQVTGTTITVGTSVEIQSGNSEQGATWDKRTKNRIFCAVSDLNDGGKNKLTPCSVEDSVSGDGLTITKGGTQYTYYSGSGAGHANPLTDYYIPNMVLMLKGQGDGSVYSAPVTGLTLGTIATEDADFLAATTASGIRSATDPNNAGWFWAMGRQYASGDIRAGILGGTY